MTPDAPPPRRLSMMLLAWLADVAVTLVPTGFAIARASAAPQWDSDLALVRDVAFLPVSVGGAASTTLTQLLSLAPLGPLGFRASLVGALALGWLARSVHRLSLAAQREAGDDAERALPLVLAALVALTVGLSPALQSAATLAGSPLLAAALSAAALEAFFEAPPSSHAPDGHGQPARVGALVALALVELPATALVLLPALVLGVLLERAARRPIADEWGGAASTGWRAELAAPEGRLVGPFGAGLVTFLLVAAFFLLPLTLRPHAVRTLGDATHLARATSGLRSFGDPGLTVLVFAREVGWFASAFVALGLASAALTTVARSLAPRAGRALPRLALTLALVAVLEAGLPVWRVPALGGPSLAPLRPLAIAVLAPLMALGLRAALRWIEALRLPAGRSVQVLVVVLQATLLALTSEEAALAADRARFAGAEAWTDEALVRLGPKSSILARTPAVTWRLYAGQLVRGERPDVLVVPVPLLGRASMTEALRAAEPAALHLLRDMSLTGSPSEYALSLLADARPLHTDLDRDWSPAIRRHLGPRGLWVGYSPQPLGPSDRKVLAQTIGPPAARLAAALAPPNENDPESARRLEQAILQQLDLLDGLKEKDATGVLAAQINDAARARGGRVEGALGGVLGTLRARAPAPSQSAQRPRR